MKVIVFENNYSQASADSNPSWYVVADSAISNAGKPFYVPDRFGEVAVSVAPAFKCCRLGKSVEPRFASRYFREVAPAVHFRLLDLKEELQRKGVSFSPAVSFDRSVMTGDFIPLDPADKPLSLKLNINGETVSLWEYKEMKQGLYEAVSGFSRLNTIKMGDVILPAPGTPFIIKEGDFIEVVGDGFKPLVIKVK